MTNQTYEPKDYKNDIAVRWCPGCGDHAILNVLHKAMAELGIPPHMIAVVSGIGCSSRLPYYMNTYGFHTIHGRGGAIATGVKVANPQLTVWQISGDGDCLAIGGNHFIHEVRRNVDLNLVLPKANSVPQATVAAFLNLRLMAQPRILSSPLSSSSALVAHSLPVESMWN